MWHYMVAAEPITLHSHKPLKLQAKKTTKAAHGSTDPQAAFCTFNGDDFEDHACPLVPQCKQKNPTNIGELSAKQGRGQA